MIGVVHLLKSPEVASSAVSYSEAILRVAGIDNVEMCFPWCGKLDEIYFLVPFTNL